MQWQEIGEATLENKLCFRPFSTGGNQNKGLHAAKRSIPITPRRAFRLYCATVSSNNGHQFHGMDGATVGFSDPTPPMNRIFLSIPSIVTALSVISCAPNEPLPPTVSTLNKKRYAGEWHEIARLPNPFERNLVAAKATYGVNSDGTISVRNEGLKADGETTSIEGTAKPADSSEPGRLLVRFDKFPANLFAGDYWILDVNDRYSRALVGSPDKKFLWLLSKDPEDGSEDFTSQISMAKNLGYETERFYYNPKRISP